MRTKCKAIFPEDMIVPPGYKIRPNGVWLKRGKGRLERLATTPAWVSGLTCDASGEHWSILAPFLTPDGKLRKRLVPYASLLAEGPDLSADLAAQGRLVPALGAANFAIHLAICAAQDGITHYRGTRKGGPRTR